ncbi:hypothetical protein HID58_013697 [Brassica napus]|uniref:Uncharacterized protein n=1 Tax=Brassica napus TaxID=3708 RepID=A0ABQ8E7E2_BRANA|nr:hypothetical protein HID58_013697 [Brassica napus]
MKDTTKKTVPTGSTSKREHSTKNNETIANNENSAILCKAQANIVSTQSTINSATSDFSKENTIIQEPAQRLKTTDNIFSQANSQIPPISLSSRSIAQRLRYKRKRTTNSIEGEVMVLSDITNQVPSGTTHTRQSYLTATHDERTIANTRIHSTTSPTGTKTDYQVKGNPCASAKRLRKNDSFSSHSNLHTPPTSFPTSSIPLSDTTDVSPSVRTQTQQEVLTPTFESSKSRLTAKEKGKGKAVASEKKIKNSSWYVVYVIKGQQKQKESAFMVMDTRVKKMMNLYIMITRVHMKSTENNIMIAAVKKVTWSLNQM